MLGCINHLLIPSIIFPRRPAVVKRIRANRRKIIDLSESPDFGPKTRLRANSCDGLTFSAAGLPAPAVNSARKGALSRLVWPFGAPPDAWEGFGPSALVRAPGRLVLLLAAGRVSGEGAGARCMPRPLPRSRRPPPPAELPRGNPPAGKPCTSARVRGLLSGAIRVRCGRHLSFRCPFIFFNEEGMPISDGDPP